MKPDPTTHAEYKNLVDLLAIHAEATARLALIQADIQTNYIDLVDGVRADFSEWQSKITETEAALEVIARDHPEWFSKTRSVKTPYGAVKFHAATKLEIPNEEATILLIESKLPEEDREKFIRTEKALNIEALEQLSDEELKPLRIKRVKNDSFSVKPGTIDLGKAVQQAESKEAA